jgi:hypothetical protein
MKLTIDQREICLVNSELGNCIKNGIENGLKTKFNLQKFIPRNSNWFEKALLFVEFEFSDWDSFAIKGRTKNYNIGEFI